MTHFWTAFAQRVLLPVKIFFSNVGIHDILEKGQLFLEVKTVTFLWYVCEGYTVKASTVCGDEV